jgi:NADPH2 dehydrogenase
MATFPRVSSLKTAEQFTGRLDELGIQLPFETALASGSDSPLSQPLTCGSQTVGNRFCILPMEGWDGTPDGKPTDLTRRRWANFGRSGAKLIWGGEAVAVRFDGRANPNQLFASEENLAGLIELRELLLREHQERFGRTDDLLIGLQLTHSGRFCKPRDKQRWESKVAYRHPILDPKFQVTDDAAVLSDDDLARLVDDVIAAARLAQRAGYSFVDIKHCHGYLGHELLSAIDRPGKYGGSLENRTRYLRDIVAGIRATSPGLELGVRLSIFDFVPFLRGDDDVGRPMLSGGYRYAFGGDGTGVGIDLTEPKALCEIFRSLGIKMVCASAGSPYYNPHLLRPAAFPPSDGYLPPEDPLVGVARQIAATAELKHAFPDLVFVGSGYSYLQEWLPHVAQGAVARGMVDSVGLGRMVLSYPEFAADVLAGKSLARKKLCRTFSDCTTAPRNGMVSGCYPLDSFYKARPENETVSALRRAIVE